MKNVVLSAVAALLFSASVQAQSTVDSIAAKYKLVPMPEALTIEKTFPVLGTYQLNTPVAPEATTGTENTSSTTGTTTVTADASTGTTTTTATDAAATGAMDAATAGNLTITLDSANKGIVWIEGLPEGKAMAYLQKSPATYRIVSQKTEDGKMTPEGTLMLDPTTNTLNIALGKAFDEVDPAAIFAMKDAATVTDNTVDVKVKKDKSKTKKTKTKLTFYTATKVMPATDETAPADATQEQQTTEPATETKPENQEPAQPSQEPAQPSPQPTPNQ